MTAETQFEVVRLAGVSATADRHRNHAIDRVNDHEVRLSVMTEAYHWHCHPDSDESVLALEGGLLIDLDARTVELLPGELLTIPRGVRHRTRPRGARSVNLAFERTGSATESRDAPPAARSPIRIQAACLPGG